MGYFVSFLICIIRLKLKFKLNYEDMTKNIIDIICGSLLMLIVLFLVRLILPSVEGRMMSLFYICIYVVLGGALYFVYMWNTKSMKRIFGERLSKFLKKKK